MDYPTRFLREPVNAPNDAVVVDYVLVAHEQLKEYDQDRYKRQGAENEDDDLGDATPSAVSK
jgi:hypothetical protein